jgi:hypothetical protein
MSFARVLQFFAFRTKPRMERFREAFGTCVGGARCPTWLF